MTVELEVPLGITAKVPLHVGDPVAAVQAGLVCQHGRDVRFALGGLLHDAGTQVSEVLRDRAGRYRGASGPDV